MNPRSTVSILGHPVHAMLVPFVIASYTGAFAADIAYSAASNPFWAVSAMWLIGAGIAVSVFAATIGFVDFVAEPAIRELPAAWWHLGGNVVMSLISILDWVLRYEVGPEAGSSAYIWLSGTVFVLLIFNGWMGAQLVYHHRVGVAD